MKLNIGIIGFGYWGPNLARNFNAHPDCTLKRLADKNPNRQSAAQKIYPYTEIVSDARAITRALDIDVVVIATPVSSHFALAKDALLNGKHVWIEKPITSTSREARELEVLAKKKKKIILVDHTFLFSGAVTKMKEMIQKKALGDIYYYDSVRVNLGLFQHDVNVLWDLAAHDLSILDFLLGKEIKGVSAVGAKHCIGAQEDVAYLTVYYKNNLIAHFHVNWLSPVKIRKTIIGGSKKMVVWNDLDPDEVLKVYDKGIHLQKGEGVYKMLPKYRVGEMFAPVVSQKEALKTETEYFIDCIKHSKKPHNDAEAGARVVRLLEAANQSLKKSGVLVRL